jgi:hypothetical protein
VLIPFQNHQNVQTKNRGNRNCLDICDTRGHAVTTSYCVSLHATSTLMNCR